MTSFEGFNDVSVLVLKCVKGLDASDLPAHLYALLNGHFSALSQHKYTANNPVL